MATLNFGLIGTGKHGIRYANHIVSDFADQARLIAIARRDPEAGAMQAKELGCRYHRDYNDLFAAADIDAVIAVLPPTNHLPIVAAAARARKPLLLEKPAAAGIDDARRILALVRQAEIPVMVAQTLRYNGVVLRLLAERASIGRIHSLRIGQRFEPSRPGWIDDPAIAGGGMTLHTGVHCFDLVRLLSGLEVESLSCDMTMVGTARSEDNFAALLRLSDGVTLATVAGSRATRSRSAGIEVCGAEGQLVGDHVLNTANRVRGAHAEVLAVPPAVATVQATLAGFIDALQNRRAMPIPLIEGLRAVAIAAACYRAAASGRSMRVESLE